MNTENTFKQAREAGKDYMFDLMSSLLRAEGFFYAKRGILVDINYRIINKNQFKISSWSGGTTTQLFIFPENSSYEARNFTWRISSATVDLEESNFTQLPDYNRILMVLKGELILNHEGQDPVCLCELEQDKFDGNVNTTSKGKVVDFNVMMKKGICTGNVETIKVDGKSTLTTIFNDDESGYENCSEVYYNIQGEISLSINESKKIVLKNNEMLIIDYKNENKPLLFDSYNSCEEEAILIRTKLYY